MPEPALGRVFISSVFGGMMDLRARTAEAARRLGFDPVLTEKRPALSTPVADVLREEIARSDTYIGVFDRRRGTVPAGDPADEDRAITERELLLARELGLRTFVFLSRAEDREPALEEFLETEVTDYFHGVWSRPYEDEAALAREVVAALAAARPRLRLTLSRGQAQLDLTGVKPAWPGEDTLAAPVDLDLSATADEVLRRFLSGTDPRMQIREEALRFLGAELFARALPGALGEAFVEVLRRAEGRLVLLEVTAEEAARRYLPWELLAPPGAAPPVASGALEVVRRLGDGAGPQVPGRHFSLLGFTASPLEDQVRSARLGGGGFAEADLFWEQEQERLLVALDPLLREKRARLVLPDAGSKETLRQELARPDRPTLLHLSCHGGAGESGEPVLFLEDDDGHRAPTGAVELLRWIHAVPRAPRVELAVLSACYTAATHPGGHPAAGSRSLAAEPTGTTVASLAEELATGRVPRVLGMQTSVSDRGATAFAEAFYSELAEGSDLPLALRAGRSALAAEGGAYEWAVPVLLAAGDTGPLIAPREVQTTPEDPFEGGAEAVFAIGGKSYLAEGYAGRRDFERRLAQKVAGERRPVVIHGLGGLGKSTLAARFLVRRRAAGARVCVVALDEALPAAALREEILEAVGIERPSGLPPEEVEQAAMERLLAELREGPAFLLLDNFEVAQGEGGELVDPEVGELLFDLAREGGEHFGLLVTSRLALPRAANLDLAELPPSAARKMKLQREGLRRLGEPEWEAVMTHLGGHPKALEVLDGYLRDRPEEASVLLRRFGEAREEVESELAREKQERGRALLVETVLEAVPDERRPSFDRLALLSAPLRIAELISLLEAEGVPASSEDLTWLRRRGLLARAVGASALEGGEVVHRLLADRWQTALEERESAEAARAWHRRVAELFEKREGLLSDLGLAADHLDRAGDRAGALGLYSRWAIALRDRHAYLACEQVAREGIRRFPQDGGEEVRLGTVDLWLIVFDCLETLGDMGRAEESLDQADKALEPLEGREAVVKAASVDLRRGRLLMTHENFQLAQEAFERAEAGFRSSNAERQRAITLGELERLKLKVGLQDEALRLHEERLEIFERLGEDRDSAVTHADFAWLKVQAGEIEEARKLREKLLGVHRKLGDLEGIALAQFDLALLDLKEDAPRNAFPRLAEAWGIVTKINRADAIALVGDVWGRALAGGGEIRQAREVFARAESAARLLGWTDEADELAELRSSLS